MNVWRTLTEWAGKLMGRFGGNNYQAGRPHAICDRCGLQYRHDELRKEWTGLLVCAACYDPKPADITPPNVRPEGLPISNPRPEPDVADDASNTTTPEDLPGAPAADDPAQGGEDPEESEPPDTPVDYPLGFVAAANQAVFDLIETPPAPRVTTNKVLGIDALPTGVTDAGGVLTFDATSQAIDFRGWNMTSQRRIFKFVGTSAHAIIVRDNVIPSPVGAADYLFNVGIFQGSAAGAPDVTIEFNDIDCEAQAINGGMGLFHSGVLHFNDNNARNFGAIGWNTTPLTAASTATRVGHWLRNYFGKMGENALNGVPGDPTKYDNTSAHTGDGSTGAHGEYIHTLGAGEWHINDNMFDLFGWDGQSGCSFSSFVSVQSYQGDNTGEILRNGFRWNNGQSFSTDYVPRGVSSPLYFMSAPASGDWAATSFDMDVGGNVLQHGQFGSTTFIVEDEQGGTTGTLTITAPNYEYETGGAL